MDKDLLKTATLGSVKEGFLVEKNKDGKEETGVNVLTLKV